MKIHVCQYSLKYLLVLYFIWWLRGRFSIYFFKLWNIGTFLKSQIAKHVCVWARWNVFNYAFLLYIITMECRWAKGWTYSSLWLLGLPHLALALALLERQERQRNVHGLHTRKLRSKKRGSQVSSCPRVLPLHPMAMMESHNGPVMLLQQKRRRWRDGRQCWLRHGIKIYKNVSPRTA